MLYLGTSGFSYDDWVGTFYPRGTPKREWLAYYSQEFSTCEINSTFYALPTPANMAALARKTGQGFLFVIKANQEMTHHRQNNALVFQAFRQAIAPLIAAGKLGCVLAQFPYSFGFSPRNRDYLLVFRERLGELPLVIEFRNAAWLKGPVFDWMRRYGLGFCCVDEPPLPNLMPPIAEATSQIAYVRFHGRNAAQWWQHEHAYQRYDYAYSPEELEPWLPKIKKLCQASQKTFVFANNHFQGKAVDTIRQLRTILEKDEGPQRAGLFPPRPWGGNRRPTD